MILERIKQYIDYKGISISAFEKSIGMGNASFGKSLKNGGAIGTDKLENILLIYPEISPDWLLTGTGKMLRSVDVTLEPEDQKTLFEPFLLIITKSCLFLLNIINMSYFGLDLLTGFRIKVKSGKTIGFMPDSPVNELIYALIYGKII